MRHNIVQSALLALALLLSTGLALAADIKPAAAGEAKAVSDPKAAQRTAKPRADKSAAKVKLVDINSAGKKELKTLPGISDAEADKIIAGRPYRSKANLVTHNIISASAYENLKRLVIARQTQEVKAAPAK
jgi:DNA uptake protein ComE-like DNA-binding protein